MHYYIDIGNTFVKFTTNPKKGITQRVPHQQIQRLTQQLRNDNAKQITMIAGRSTQAKEAKMALVHFAEKYRIPVSFVAVDRNLLDINYKDSASFGVDRFLNLLAAKERLGRDFCVVSCGSAITLDFYTHRHIGGMITPGIGLAKACLAEKTGLTSIERPIDLLGNSTATAIGAGVYWGYQNLIFASISNVEKAHDQRFHVLFTGGDAEVLSKNKETVLELLFEGMQKYNFLTKQIL